MFGKGYGLGEGYDEDEGADDIFSGADSAIDFMYGSRLPGWIIPHNYPDGDDILLADDGNITPVEEPEEDEVSQEGLPPGAWRTADFPGYWTREGTTTIYHMTPEEIAEREQRKQQKAAAGPVKAEEATWSRPLYHGTSSYRAKKITAQKSFYGETEGYNEMGVGVYTHPSMNRTSPWAAGRAQGAFMELHFTRPLKLAVKNPQGDWVPSMGGESQRWISKTPTQRELIDAGYDGIYDKHGTTQVPHQVLLFNQPVLGSGGAKKLNQLIDWDKVRIINFNESQHGYLKGLENTEEAPYYRGASKEAAGKPVWPPYEEWIDGFHPYLVNEAAEQGEENLEESEELRGLYDDFVRVFSSWKFPLTIWRAVKLGSIEDLDTAKLGVAWTFRENMAIPYGGVGGENFILKARVPANSIDWDMTMELNLYGGEDEVRLIEGAPVQLEGYNIKGKWFPLKKRLTASDDRPISPLPALSFVKDARFTPSKYLLISVDTQKLDREWSKDIGFYLAPGSKENHIGDRYARFQTWLQEHPGAPIEAPFVSWKMYPTPETGGVGFLDGRHRFAVLRDMGYKTVNIVIEDKQLPYFKPLMAHKTAAEQSMPKEFVTTNNLKTLT